MEPSCWLFCLIAHDDIRRGLCSVCLLPFVPFPNKKCASRDRQEDVRVWAGLNNRIVPLLRPALHNIIPLSASLFTTIIFSKARHTITWFVVIFPPCTPSLAARFCARSLLVELRGPHGSLPAIHLVFRIMYIQFGLCFVRLSPGGVESRQSNMVM